MIGVVVLVYILAGDETAKGCPYPVQEVGSDHTGNLRGEILEVSDSDFFGTRD